MEEISEHAKGLTLSDDLEKSLEERVNLFYNFVKVGFMTGVCLERRYLNQPSYAEQIKFSHVSLLFHTA